MLHPNTARYTQTLHGQNCILNILHSGTLHAKPRLLQCTLNYVGSLLYMVECGTVSHILFNVHWVLNCLALGGLKGNMRPDQAVAIGTGLISGTISAHSRTTRFDQYVAQPPAGLGQFLGQSPPISAETFNRTLVCNELWVGHDPECL